MTIERLDDDEKALLKRGEYDPTYDYSSELGSGNLRSGAVKKWFVTEPGLYTLVCYSAMSFKERLYGLHCFYSGAVII